MRGSKVIKGDTMKEVRARVILQEKGLYIINYDGNDKYAEVSGKSQSIIIIVNSIYVGKVF